MIYIPNHKFTKTNFDIAQNKCHKLGAKTSSNNSKINFLIDVKFNLRFNLRLGTMKTLTL
jgi:hypothetical protein